MKGELEGREEGCCAVMWVMGRASVVALAVAGRLPQTGAPAGDGL